MPLKQPKLAVPIDSRAMYALKALAKGECEPHQQKFLLQWLMKTTHQTYDDLFVPDNARMTDYLLGRRSIGVALTTHLNLDPQKMKLQEVNDDA